MKKFLAGVSTAFLLVAIALLLIAPARAQVSGTTIVSGSTPVVGTCTSGYNLYNNSGVVGCQAGGGGSGTVTSVSASDGLLSVATPTTTPAISIAGTSGGIPYFNSASTWASSGLLAANALMIGGGAGVAPSTVTTGTGVLTALGSAPTGSGNIVLAASPTLTGTVTIPAITSPASTILGLGAPTGEGVALTINSTTVASAFSGIFQPGTSVSLGNASHVWAGTWTTTLSASGAATLGSLSINGDALALGAALTTTGAGATTLAFGATGNTYAFPDSSDTVATLAATQTLTNKSIAGSEVNSGTVPIAQIPTGTTSSTVPLGGVIAAGGPTGSATAVPVITYNAAGQLTAVTTAAIVPLAAPLTVGTGGSLTGAYGYYICTTTCSITLPTPAAGDQFCVRNDSAVTTAITIVAITSVQFEKTTFNGYGTVTTGTMVSGGALGDKICLVGRDATHYLVGTFVGTWTNS